MGANPEGFVHDPVGSPTDGLIEIKYVSLNSRETLRDALLRKRICKLVEGQNITINRNHQYFYQVQQQMFCGKRFWTDFLFKGGVEI